MRPEGFMADRRGTREQLRFSSLARGLMSGEQNTELRLCVQRSELLFDAGNRAIDEEGPG